MKILTIFFFIINLYLVNSNNIIYPKTIIKLDDTYNYTIQYKNNSIWINSNIEVNNTIIYNNLLEYKKFDIRISNNSCIECDNSNIYNIAHIDMSYNINKNNNTLNIHWKNINFNDTNNFFLDYYFFDKKYNHPRFNEKKINNIHSLNLTNVVNNLLIYDFNVVVKSRKYKVSNIIHIKFDNLINVYTDNKHSKTSYCISRYCLKPKKKNQICINNKIYKSVCYSICHNEYFEKFSDFKLCNISSSTTTTTLTTTTLTTTTLTTLPTITSIPNINKLKNFELVFTGIQSCKNNKQCKNATRFSTAKESIHTKHLMTHNDLTVHKCLTHCEEDFECLGVYIFYTIYNGFRCRILSNLGTYDGNPTILYDYSFKFIGNRTTFTTPTTTNTITNTMILTPTLIPYLSNTLPPTLLTKDATLPLTSTIITKSITLLSNKQNISLASNISITTTNTNNNKFLKISLLYWIFIISGIIILLWICSLYFICKNKHKPLNTSNITMDNIDNITGNHYNNNNNNNINNIETENYYNHLNRLGSSIHNKTIERSRLYNNELYGFPEFNNNNNNNNEIKDFSDEEDDLDNNYLRIQENNVTTSL